MRVVIFCFLLQPLILFAQKGTDHYSCCEGHNPCVYIYGRKALEAHNCQFHGRDCQGSGNGYSAGNGRKASKAALLGAFLFGSIGAAYGSTQKDENGQSRILDYGAAGFLGGALVGAIIFSPKKKSGSYGSEKVDPSFLSNIRLVFSAGRAGILVEL